MTRFPDSPVLLRRAPAEQPDILDQLDNQIQQMTRLGPHAVPTAMEVAECLRLMKRVVQEFRSRV